MPYHTDHPLGNFSQGMHSYSHTIRDTSRSSSSSSPLSTSSSSFQNRHRHSHRHSGWFLREDVGEGREGTTQVFSEPYERERESERDAGESESGKPIDHAGVSMPPRRTYASRFEYEKTYAYRSTTTTSSSASSSTTAHKDSNSPIMYQSTPSYSHSYSQPERSYYTHSSLSTPPPSSPSTQMTGRPSSGYSYGIEGDREVLMEEEEEYEIGESVWHTRKCDFPISCTGWMGGSFEFEFFAAVDCVSPFAAVVSVCRRWERLV